MTSIPTVTPLARVRLDRRGVVRVVEEVRGRERELQVLCAAPRSSALASWRFWFRCLIDGSVDGNFFQNGLSFADEAVAEHHPSRVCCGAVDREREGRRTAGP
jgi:hypothetical protein